jgi:periplasmic divalent cation tolerance protein
LDRYIIVYCTVPSTEIGIKIANDLVESHSAACVNIIPGLTSIYRWKGEICRDNEQLLIIKSRNSLFEKIQERIKALHPYEVPEIISYDIAEGSDRYFAWISENTDKA